MVVLFLTKDFTEIIKSNKPKMLIKIPSSSLKENTKEGKILLERKIINTLNMVIIGGGILFFIWKIINLDEIKIVIIIY